MSSADTITAATTSGSPPRPAPARLSGRRREQVAKILFVVPAAVAMVLLFGYPVVKNLTMSFQEYGLKTFFTGEAPFVGLANYVEVVTDQLFRTSLINTALFTLGIDSRPVRHRLAAGLVLPQELPAERRPAGAAAACPG